MNARYTLEEFQAWRVTLEGMQKEKAEKKCLLNGKEVDIEGLQRKGNELQKAMRAEEDKQQCLQKAREQYALIAETSEIQQNYKSIEQQLISLGKAAENIKSECAIKKIKKKNLDEAICLLQQKSELSNLLLEKQREREAIQAEIDQQKVKHAEQEPVKLEQSIRKSMPLGKAHLKNTRSPSLLPNKTSTETLSQLAQQLVKKNQEILDIRKQHDENFASLSKPDIQATATIAELTAQSSVLSNEILELKAALDVHVVNINELTGKYNKISPAEIAIRQERIGHNSRLLDVKESKLEQAISDISEEIKRLKCHLEQNKKDRELARDEEVEYEKRLLTLESEIRTHKKNHPFLETITTIKLKDSKQLFTTFQRKVNKEFKNFDENVENIINQTPKVRLFLMQIGEKARAITERASSVSVSRVPEDECKVNQQQAETDQYIKQVLLPYIQLGGLVLKMRAQLINENGEVKNKQDANFCVMLNKLIERHQWDEDECVKECEKLLSELEMQNDLEVGAAFRAREQEQYAEVKARLGRAVEAFRKQDLKRDQKANDRRSDLLDITERLFRSIDNGEGNAHQKTRATIVYKMAELIEYCNNPVGSRRIPDKKVLRILEDFEKLAKHQTHGKPSLSKKIVGAMLVLAGAFVMMALNVFGGWLGGGALILSGAGLFYSGRIKGQSHLLEKFESSLTAYRNYRCHGSSTPAGSATPASHGRY